MSELRTYYGPWLGSFPSDAPYGSLWDYRVHNGGIHRHYFTHEGALSSRLAELSAKRTPGIAIRRVYPPGSVMPEPRPVFSLKLTELKSSSYWMVQTVSQSWRVFPSREMGACPQSAIGYPVDPLPNGAFVARPWPDQLGEEQP